MPQARDDSLELRSDIGEVLNRKKKNGWIKYAAIGVVAILIIAGVVYYLARPKGTGIEPAIVTPPGIDIDKVPAGLSVEFDASSSKSGSGISDVAWDFGDGGTASGMKVTHAFSQKGTYEVTVTITDRNGNTGSKSVRLTVVGTIVTVPVGRIGDTIDYELSGFVEIKNSKTGFWTYVYTEKPTPYTTITVTVDVLRANMSVDGQMTVSTDVNSVEDGFGSTHKCVERSSSSLNTDLSGTADLRLTKKGVKSELKNQKISGTVRKASQVLYTDLNTNRTIQTQNSDDYTIRLGDSGSASGKEKSGADQVTAFPMKREEFSVDKLRANRTFSNGEHGSKTSGDNTIEWKVVREEAVGETPCLIVHMWMDASTMDKYGFDVFDSYAWISNDFSMPLKLFVRTEGVQENGNKIVAEYISTYSSYSTGSDPLPFGTCDAVETSDGHFFSKNHDVSYEAPGTYAPADGDDKTIAEYPLEGSGGAVEFARAHSTSLNNYLTQNPNAFLINASFNKFSGAPTWDLFFGEKDKTEAHHIIVTKTSVVLEDQVETVDTIGKSIKEYTSTKILTFASAEKVFTSNAAINAKVYSSGNFKTSSYSLGCRSDVTIPTPEVPIGTDFVAKGTEYYFYVESKDGSYSAGVDGGTGQILFIKTQ